MLYGSEAIDRKMYPRRRCIAVFSFARKAAFGAHSKLCIGIVLGVMVLACTAERSVQRISSSCQGAIALDGDTIACHDGRRIRLQCVDAPELAQHPWGAQATAALAAVLPASGEALHLVEFGVDQYGRTIAQLRVSGDNPILALVRQGHMAVYKRYCTERAYYLSQAEAQREKRGIWRQSGWQQQPWVWRQRQ